MARKWKAKAIAAKVVDHRLLDASNKLAAAIASISNEFKYQINGSLTVKEFPKSERHRSAFPVVYSSRQSVEDYGINNLGANPMVSPRGRKKKSTEHAVYVVNAGYTATS